MLKVSYQRIGDGYLKMIIILVSKFGSRGVFLHHPLEFKERPNWNSVGASNTGRLPKPSVMSLSEPPNRFLSLTLKLLSWYFLGQLSEIWNQTHLF